MGRLLDVLFQHLGRLAAAVAVVPLLAAVGAAALSADRQVTARVRVDPAAYVADAFPDLFAGTVPDQSPAQAAGAVVQQLLATDGFAGRLLDAAGAGAGAPPARREAALADLRAHLSVVVEGESLFSLRYATSRPAWGVALLGALLREMGDAVQAMEARRAAAALQVAGGELDRAHEEAQRAVEAAAGYASSSGEGGDALALDPTYRRLVAAVQDATDRSQELADLAERAREVSTALPQVRAQAAAVVDPPQVEPAPRAAAAVKPGLAALAGTLALGLLTVYVVALRDPRLRDPGDARCLVPGGCRVSLPPLDRPPGMGMTAHGAGRTAAGRGAGRHAAERAVLGRAAMRSLAGALIGRLGPGGMVGVVSPHRGEGRSSVAAGLALTLAGETGARVLLLDLDAERPAQAAAFGVEAPAGTGDRPGEAAWPAAAAVPVRPGLWVLPVAATSPAGAQRLLREVATGGLLDGCRAGFAWTVADLPPLLGAPGAAAVAGLLDGCVLVGRHRSTATGALARAAALLPRASAGFVMTAHASPVPAWIRRILMTAS
jgi:Mrp family chromosome partitioning ATPase